MFPRTSGSPSNISTGRAVATPISRRSRLLTVNSTVAVSGTRVRPTNEANGSVLDQLYKGKRVREGDRIPMGAVITLIVGQNDLGEPIELMNFVGMTMDEAKYVLDTLGASSYNFVCPECITHEDSVVARIFSQTPEFIEGNTVFKSTQFTFSMKIGFDSEIELPE